MLKKSRFILGLSFLAQSLSFLVLFFSFFKKRRTFANTFLAVAISGGLTGALFIILNAKDEQKQKRMQMMDDSFSDMDPAVGKKYDYDEDFDQIKFIEKDIPLADENLVDIETDEDKVHKDEEK